MGNSQSAYTDVNQMLFHGIVKGDLELVAEAAIFRANLNCIDHEAFGLKKNSVVKLGDKEYRSLPGFTPLVWCLFAKINPKTRLKLINFLIEEGADINQPTLYGRTGLGWAIYLNQVASVKCLLKAGAKVKQIDDQNTSAYQAVMHNYFNSILELPWEQSLRARKLVEKMMMSVLHIPNWEVSESDITRLKQVSMELNTRLTDYYPEVKHSSFFLMVNKKEVTEEIKKSVNLGPMQHNSA